MQPLRTKKLRSLWGQKITQPLTTTKINLLGQRNHATSRDKTKIMQPLGAKKSGNFSEQKNHATSRDKKNHATSLKFLSGHFDFVTVDLGLVCVCFVMKLELRYIVNLNNKFRIKTILKSHNRFRSYGNAIVCIGTNGPHVLNSECTTLGELSLKVSAS